MGTSYNKPPATEYSWYWIAIHDPFSNEEPEWAPYDIAVNQEIEENLANQKLIFEIRIGIDIYVVNLEKKIQYLKSNPYRQRSIIRASGKDNIRVFRKNRFAGVIDSSAYKNNLVTNHEEKSNLQVRFKVYSLFGEPEKGYLKSFMYQSNNLLFHVEICISSSIHKELKGRFFNKLSFSNENEIIIYLKKEISEEAQRLTTKQNEENVVSSSNATEKFDFNEQARTYISLLQNEDQKLSLEEKLIKLYTAEGFIVYSINLVLRTLILASSKLPLYFTLLQGSIDIVSKKHNHKYSSKSIKKIKGVEYYVFYRGAQISEDILNNDKQSLSKKTGIFRVYNEFLSTTYAEHIAFRFLFKDDLKENHVPVFYKFLIPKEIADKTPNLFCFVEDLSRHPQEKEALLSSSTIFQVQNIEPKDTDMGSYYELTSLFISNGFNKYDFLKYTSLHNINLSLNEIGVEEGKAIGDALRTNTSLQYINMSYNNIGDEGGKAFVDALKTNTSLQYIHLRENKLGDEGAKAIADLLRTNTSLQVIYLDDNQIGYEGAKAIADALKTNTFLQFIDLGTNKIGDEAANAIGDALRTNTSLKEIDLERNQIGDEGAKAIGEALRTNTSLQSIWLDNNQIGDKGANAIGDALKTNTSLQKIYLCENQIGDEGVKAIVDALRTNTNTSLKEIHMRNNNIGDEGSKAIGDTLRNNSTLQRINLWKNKIGDEGGKVIGDALRDNTSLEEINLNDNQIGDEGGKAIGDALITNTSLKEIHMQNNNIGDETGKLMKSDKRIKFY